MILTGPEINKAISEGDIVLRPFMPQRLNPNSVDVTLGSDYLRHESGAIDPSVRPSMVAAKIPNEGYTFEANDFILGSTVETIGSTRYVPILHGKSSTARAGLFVHVTADLIDIGSIGCLTLQLYFVLPLRLYPGMPIGQVSFWRPYGKIDLYKGKYQNSAGPRASEGWRDPFWKGIKK